MTRLFCFISILLIPILGFGQKEKMDSLNERLNLEKDDFNKLSILGRLCEYCELSDNLKYASESLKIIDKLKKSTKDTSVYHQLLSQEADAYSYIGIYYGENNYYNKNNAYDPEKSVSYYNKALDLYKQIRLWPKITEMYGLLEDMYLREGNMYMILQSFKEAIDFGQTNNNNFFVAKYIYSTAMFYARMGDTTNAMHYAEEGIALEKKINDPKRLAKGYLLGADLYFKIKQYQKAVEYYNKALTEYQKNNDKSENAFIYFGLGTTYAGLNNYELANRNLTFALSFTDSLCTNNVAYIEFLIELGRLERQFKHYDQAIVYHKRALDKSEMKGFPGGICTSSHELAKDLFDANKPGEAKKYAEQALMIKKQITSVEQIMKTEQLCFKIDSALGNFGNALIHYMAYTQLQDKINIDEVKKSSMKDDLQRRFDQEKAKEKLLQEKKDAEVALEIKQQKFVRNGFIIGFIILCIMAAVILRSYLIKKNHSRILELKNNEIVSQKHLIEEKQNEILDSIGYAKRLQQAILPSNEFVSAHLTDNFILYQPKDIVAGDFYWAEKINDLFFIAAADSTGHGVPGALVSIVCSNALNRSINEFNQKETGKILDKTRDLVLETFEKSTTEVKDGMDISILCIDLKNKKVFWSGANNPLWYIQNDELKKIKADKQAIGKTDNPKPFTTHQIEYKPNTIFYLFTDGLADQFGGPKGKKFMYRQFEEILVSVSKKSMAEQSEIIAGIFDEWKGKLEQVDDVCVIGVKI